MIEKAILQQNVERAIRFERSEGNGKPLLVVDPDNLEVEVFFRIKGASGLSFPSNQKEIRNRSIKALF